VVAGFDGACYLDATSGAIMIRNLGWTGECSLRVLAGTNSSRAQRPGEWRNNHGTTGKLAALARHKSATGTFLFSFLVLLFSLFWDQCIEAQTQQRQESPASAGQPAKTQPPPLFPKHRRGIYKNNQSIDVIDATPQAPPHEIDDPGVPDNGEYEINLNTNGDFSRGNQKLDLFFFDGNYGILPKIFGHEVPTQVKVEFPYSGIKHNGESYAFGIGGGTLGLKFNVYNNENTGGLTSVYPQLELSLPASADKGLAERGQTLVLPLLVSRKLSYATLVVNVGLEQPFHDPKRKTTGTFGVGLGRALMRQFAVMSEIHGESAFDFKTQRTVVWNVGVIYSVRHVPVYARIGRSLFSDDGGRHTLFIVGVKLIRDTKTAVKTTMTKH